MGQPAASALTAAQMTFGSCSAPPPLPGMALPSALPFTLPQAERSTRGASLVLRVLVAHGVALFASLALLALGGRTLVMTSLPHRGHRRRGGLSIDPLAWAVEETGWYGFGIDGEVFATRLVGAVLRLERGRRAAADGPRAHRAATALGMAGVRGVRRCLCRRVRLERGSTRRTQGSVPRDDRDRGRRRADRAESRAGRSHAWCRAGWAPCHHRSRPSRSLPCSRRCSAFAASRRPR